MDRATKIAQEAVHYVMEDSRRSEPPGPLTPMAFEAAFAEKLRKYFPQTRRKVRCRPPAVATATGSSRKTRNPRSAMKGRATKRGRSARSA